MFVEGKPQYAHPTLLLASGMVTTIVAIGVSAVRGLDALLLIECSKVILVAFLFWILLSRYRKLLGECKTSEWAPSVLVTAVGTCAMVNVMSDGIVLVLLYRMPSTH